MAIRPHQVTHPSKSGPAAGRVAIGNGCVIPAQAGIQRRWTRCGCAPNAAGSRFRGNDEPKDLARQIGRRVDVARDAGVVRLDELQLPLVRADNRFRALVA